MSKKKKNKSKLRLKAALISQHVSFVCSESEQTFALEQVLITIELTAVISKE